MRLFVDNLSNSDFSYLHPSRGLLGETWLSHIELEGELDEQGMVCDFGLVKPATRRLLDESIDHKLLVPGRAPNLQHSHNGDRSELRWQLVDGGEIHHSAPAHCVTLIDAEAIDPASVARWCEAALRRQLPASLQRVHLHFSTETIDGPYYHYSHGLKKHAGKCQRIAHGHRSRIHILRDGKPAPDLEEHWARRLRDSYVGSREDLREAEGVPENHLYFAYEAPEGPFQLQLPSRQCELLDSDSTVEQIAGHIARQLKSAEPRCQFTVKAYEGLGKGALVSL